MKETREAYYRRGILLYDMNKYNDAEKDVTRAIELDPNHWQSFYLRAKCRDKMKEYDGALQDYTVVSCRNTFLTYSV